MRRKLFIAFVFSFFILIFIGSMIGFTYTLTPNYTTRTESPIVQLNKPIELNEAKLIKNLNISTEYPKITSIAYSSGSYYLMTDNSIYMTNDFSDYKKLKLSLYTPYSSYCLISSTDFVYYNPSKKALYRLNKNNKLKKLIKLRNFSTTKACLINDTLFLLDSKITDTRIIYKKDFTIVKLPEKKHHNIKTDGSKLYSVFTGEPTGDYLPLHYSSDGLNWTSTEAVIPLNNINGYSVKIINNRTYIKTNLNDTINSSNYYEINFSDAGPVIEQIFSYYNTKIVELSEENLKIFNIFSTDNMNNSYYGMTTSSTSILLDMPIIRQLPSIGGKFIYCNNQLFFVGDYGIIFKSADTFNWLWAGMYQRTIYSSYANDSSHIKSQGLFQSGDYIWLNLSNSVRTFGNTPYPLLYCTKDGINWQTVNTNLEDYVDILRNNLELYVQDNTLYYFDQNKKLWWNTTFTKKGSDVTTIKMQYSNEDTMYDETGLIFPLD